MFGSYLFILRRRALNIVVLMLPLVPLAFLYLTSRPPIYESHAVLEVGTGTISEGLLGVSRPYEEPVRRVASIADIVTSRPVVEIAHNYLRDQGQAPDFVTARPRRASNYIDITATGRAPDEASAVTNAYLIAFFEHRRIEQEKELQELEDGLVDRQRDAQRQLRAAEAAVPAGATGSPEQAAAQASLDNTARLLQTVRLRQEVPPTGVDVLSGASSPTRPSNELNPILAMLLSLVGVFFVACGLTLLLELIRDAVRTRDEVERITDAPVLGEVSRQERGAARSSEGSASTNARALRLGLLARSGGSLPSSVLVATLPDDVEDGLVAAVALANGCADSGQRVLLVSDVAPWSSSEHAGGNRLLVDTGQAPDELTLFQSPDQGFAWCPAASGEGRRGLLDLPVPKRAMEDLATSFDLVILAPGLSPMDVAYLVEATIVVCSIGRTHGRQFARFLDTIERDLGPVRGVILTRPALSARTGARRGLLRRSAEHPAHVAGAAPEPAGVDGKLETVLPVAPAWSGDDRARRSAGDVQEPQATGRTR